MTTHSTAEYIDLEYTCHGVPMMCQADGEHKCPQCGRRTKPPQQFTTKQMDPDPEWPELEFD